MNEFARDSVSRAALWFGLFGGAIAWTVHLLGAYAVAEFGCLGRPAHYDYLGITLVAWMELALTAVTTLAAVAATAVAVHCYRRLQSSEPAEVTGPTAERDTAWAAVLTSGTFVFIILFESLPILYYLQSC